VRILHDFQGLAIRLTDERLAHILEHPEMTGMQSLVEQTLDASREGSGVVERAAGKVVLPFLFRDGCGRQVPMRGGENHC
jgi:hypothetical protein